MFIGRIIGVFIIYKVMDTSFQEEILSRLRLRTKTIEENSSYISQTLCSIAEIFIHSIKSGSKLMFCGNGGSAAESQHMAAEYCATLDHKRPRKGMPAMSLTTDTSLITAWSNDFGFEGIFERQIETLGNTGDVLVAYSTSGSSANICKAAEAAKSKGMTIVGFTGNHKNMPLEAYTDEIFKAPSQETPIIQEIHTVVGHEICSYVERKLFNFE